MAKRRSGRRTKDENRMHDQAVKLRKMTDEQLVHYVEDRVAKARSEGFNQGSEKAAQKASIPSILDEIGTIKGIGKIKLLEIDAVLKKQLEGDGYA